MTHSPTSAPRISRAQSRPPAAGRPAGHHRARPPPTSRTRTHHHKDSDRSAGPSQTPRGRTPQGHLAANAPELPLWARQELGSYFGRGNLPAIAPVCTWRQTLVTTPVTRSRPPSPGGKRERAGPKVGARGAGLEVSVARAQPVAVEPPPLAQRQRREDLARGGPEEEPRDRRECQAAVRAGRARVRVTGKVAEMGGRVAVESRREELLHGGVTAESRSEEPRPSAQWSHGGVIARGALARWSHGGVTAL